MNWCALQSLKAARGGPILNESQGEAMPSNGTQHSKAPLGPRSNGRGDSMATGVAHPAAPPSANACREATIPGELNNTASVCLYGGDEVDIYPLMPHLEEAPPVGEIDGEHLRTLLARVGNGFYDSPAVHAEVARRILAVCL